jgi:crotonobetainyl-CoA:carnitine CoA-transferase CaiB-like acyl-CoA transferase
MPLRGVRVLDATNYLSGPLASAILADFGADVVKVEHPKGGDPVRKHGDSKNGVYLWWKELGRNKRSISLYLGDARGQEVFRKLARTADVVIENFRPGTMAKWGLDYATLSRENPRLIMAHISGFGQYGPRSTEPAFGTLAESMSGFAHRCGFPDGPPTLPPLGLGDSLTGMSAAMGILMALLYRERTGRGQEIDQSMMEPMLTVLEPQLITYDQLGRDLFRVGNRSAILAPRDLYPSSDGRWVAVSATSDVSVVKLLNLVGAGDLLEEDWALVAEERKKHDDEMDEWIAPWIAARKADEALKQLVDAGVPATLVYSPKDILQDEQLRARGSIVEVSDEDLGTVKMPNVLFQLSASPGRIRSTGPALGEHNVEVYREIGIGEPELAELQAAGVV